MKNWAMTKKGAKKSLQGFVQGHYRILYQLALRPWRCACLSSGALYLDCGSLWSPISPLGLQSHSPTLPPDRNGLSRFWVPLFGRVFLL